MKLKEVISNIWDEIKYYVYWIPIDKYKTIRHWWICNGTNPYHWKLIWYTIFHQYGWDNSFNWEVLRLCILKSRYYFQHHQYISQEHIDYTIRWQTTAINLLDIILEKKNLWDYEYTYYKCLVNVNMRNMDRFAYRGVDYETGKIYKTTKCYELEPHELYKEKARKLLLRILDEHSIHWWD